MCKKQHLCTHGAIGEHLDTSFSEFTLHLIQAGFFFFSEYDSKIIFHQSQPFGYRRYRLFYTHMQVFQVISVVLTLKLKQTELITFLSNFSLVVFREVCQSYSVALTKIFNCMICKVHQIFVSLLIDPI